MAEAMGTITAAELRKTAWDVGWSSVFLGAVDEVKPSIELMFVALKAGSLGDNVVLDEVFDGLGDKAQVSIVCQQSTLERIRAITPWASAVAAKQVLLTPALGVRIYQYAALLTLHPRDNAGTTEDWEFFKAVPVYIPPARDGKKQDSYEVIFRIFPDQTKIAAGTAAYMRVKGDGT